MARTPVSGEQHVLRAGAYDAIIASVGASLRSLTHRGRDLVVPFDADELRPGFRGATLAPWPNRIVDGRYVFGGEEYRVALTEPERGHALHGLLGWSDYSVTDKGSSHVTLTATIEPQVGYPWRVAVETTYALSSEGLTQSVTARNESATAAPWGVGPHPYLVAGEELIDALTLTLPAAEVLEVTPDRLSPTRLSPVDVDADRFDFRSARPLGAVQIDHAFTSLERDPQGLATVTVTDAEGRGVAMDWDASCPWVQIHTADVDGDPQSPGYRVGLAVEPMTCAPDAFNDASYPFDTGVIEVAPGAQHPAAQWRIRAID
ncbi:aldose 1-epimerase family protein [Microbacterium sp. P07]|uniref:aldose 1-epimerase family protein n=1 Tax=Microbacterium sp. P07 TaxID=3366952 RepID=UPI003747479B